MSIGLKSDSSGTSGSIVINGSDAVLVTPTGITTASIQDSSVTTAKIADANITTAKIADANITFNKLSTSTTEADNVAKRIIKAWVMFNGANLTAYSTQSFNISSIARIAGATTGGFRVSFTTAMPAANYSVLGTVGQGNEAWNSVAAASVRIVNATTGYVDFVTPQQNANAIDFGYTSIAVLSS